MSFANYSDLKTEIEDWLKRSDLSGKIDDFIDLAEARMQKELSTLDMEAATSVTLSGATTALPADWHNYRNIWIVYAGTRHHLKYKTPHEISRFNDGGSGLPSYFTIEDDTLRVEPPPDSNYELGYLYLQKILALDGTNTTNWVLTNHPGAYLAGALAEGFLYIRDMKSASTWEARFKAALRAIKREDRQNRWSGAPMAVSAN